MSSIGNAIVNQALGAANKSMMGGLKKVMGNLPGTGLGGAKVAGIKNPGSGSLNLSYPLDVEQNDAQGHYIMFMINTVDAAKVAKSKADRSAAAGTTEADRFRAGYLGEDLQSGGVDPTDKASRYSEAGGAPAGAIAITRPETTKLARAISLYMPPSVKATYSTSYKDEEIGPATEMMGGAIQSAFNSYAKGAESGGFTGGMSSFLPKWAGGNNVAAYKGGGQGMADAAVPMALATAKGALNTLGPMLGLAGAGSAFEIAGGKILSSKMELLFTGVGRRKFNYTFTFIPKSEKEAQVVHEIVQTFKIHMMPDFSSLTSPDWTPWVGNSLSTKGQGRILSIPDTFDIQYMFHSNENPWMNKISTCYLQQMDVQYGAGEKQSFYEPLENNLSGKSGPPPQTTTVSLAFEEMEKMSRPRMEQGF